MNKTVQNNVDAYLAKQTVHDLQAMLDFPWPDKMHIDVFIGTTLQLVREVCKRAGHPVVLLGESYMMYDGEKYFKVSPKALAKHLVGPIVRQGAMKADNHMNNMNLYDLCERKASAFFTVEDVFGRPITPAKGIPFKNGLLTYEYGEVKFTEGTNAEWLNTYIIDAKWGTTPKATPTWDKFISFAVSDRTLRDYVHAWIGNAIASDPIHAERAMMFVGIGGAGKSTILNVARDIVGTEAVTDVPSLGKLTDNEGRYAAGMESSALCISSDSSANVKEKDALKVLISKEPMTIEMKYQNPRTIIPRASVMLACNDSGIAYLLGDSGLKRRLDMIRFDKKPKKHDPDLGKKLTKESQAIAHRMAVEWIEYLKANGGRLTRPEAMVQTIEAESSDNNPILSALNGAGLRINPDGGELWIMEHELYAYVHEFYLNNGFNVQRFNSASLKSRLSEYGTQKARGTGGRAKFLFEVNDPILFQESKITPMKTRK